VQPRINTEEIFEEFQNELYLLYGVITDEELDSEVEWTKNLLFDDTNYLLPNENALPTLIKQLKQLSRKETDYIIGGRTLVGAILYQAQNHFVQADALVFIEQYVLKYLIPVPYRFDLVANFDMYTGYRFISDDHPRFYFDVINVPQPNDEHKKQSNRNGITLISKDIVLPFENPYFHPVVSSVENIMQRVCSSQYMDRENGTFDYKSFAESDLFVEMAMCSSSLYHMNLEEITFDKRAFLINVYNMMVIQGQIVRGCGDSEEDRIRFLEQDLYYIGQHKYSPNDIEHLLLNQPHLIPEYKYLIRQYACTNPDKRVVYVLCNGSMGSPLPFAVSSEHYDHDMAQIATHFVSLDINFEEETKCFTLSDLYIKYRHLFPPKLYDLILSMSEYLDTENQTKLANLLKESREQLNVNFRDRNYISNRKQRETQNPGTGTEQFVEPDFHQILASDFYRSYLAKYCRIEFSMENITFYEAIQQWKNANMNPMERKLKAIHLYHTYLDERSELEINVTRASVEDIEANLFQSRPKSRTPRKSVFDRMPKNYDEVVATGASPLLSPSDLSPPISMSTSPITTPEIVISIENNTSNDDDDKEITVDLFSSIESQVKCLLNDTYSRFVNSETYRNMLEDAREQQILLPPSRTHKQSFFIGDLTKLRREVPSLALSPMDRKSPVFAEHKW
jgi:hypothetical protein